MALTLSLYNDIPYCKISFIQKRIVSFSILNSPFSILHSQFQTLIFVTPLNTPVSIHDKCFEPLLHEDTIRNKVKALANRINNDLVHTNPLFVAVLNGSFMFAADLLREITIPCEIAFVRLESYSGTQSTGEVKGIIGLTQNITGRTLVILEDIVDTGKTIDSLIQTLQTQAPAAIHVATAFMKPGVYNLSHEVRYVAAEIGDEFVVGYGLDYNQQGRNLKHLYVLQS